MTTTIKYEILLTILDISKGGMTTDRLAMRRAVSERTIKKYIADAREMGAIITSFRLDSGIYYWRVENWNDIEADVLAWIELETEGFIK